MFWGRKKPEPVQNPYGGYQIAFQELSKWGVQIAGPQGLVIRPIKGMEPNWFHRIMQRLVLGFVWKKYE